ncbi:hypothetical protein L21SP3_01784 [Sedimentisphaera cyanobacteriorum]|uniref:Ice-binding protein C-terminal domain-containing protein n=1 Tax=Sedimentisphaera cyanobacteriorum TaxID=1940790 RepID=A0A1Q2HRV8_9BACT|nr:hypothetical protein L21SP3_01784 [Sedimentisphaera cyanobacteriorum]
MLILLSVFCGSVCADYISIKIYEQGDDVIVSHSGSLDISGFKGQGSYSESQVGSSGYDSMIDPRDGYICNASGISAGDTEGEINLETTVLFGFGSGALADSASGDYFNLEGSGENDLHFLPENVDQNDILTVNGSMTFQNKTLADFMMYKGTYPIDDDSNFADGEKIEITITPEPATLALLGLGGFVLRRRNA